MFLEPSLDTVLRTSKEIDGLHKAAAAEGIPFCREMIWKLYVP